MAQHKLQVSELDFDKIKANLKTFLQSQTQFQDYDFEGSGLSILLDVLSYNTHYLSYIANMSTNEMYLDSADIRKNIVSLAKMLGYTPTSPRAPRASIDIVVNNATGSSITMKPLGDISLTSNLGVKGITASALLGNISMSTLLSSFDLKNTGSASMKGLLGEVTVGTSGKVKVKGLIASLAEILNELIDIITEHTHPTGTGPSGPPMPPASVKLPLLKSLKIGMSLE